MEEDRKVTFLLQLKFQLNLTPRFLLGAKILFPKMSESIKCKLLDLNIYDGEASF